MCGGIRLRSALFAASILNMFSERVHARSTQRQQTRQKVVGVAEELFRAQGFAATTVRQIASVAEVSVGTVIAVGDKATLLVRIYDGWITDFHQQRVVEPLAGRPVDAIIDHLRPIIGYFVQDAELSREYAAILVRGEVESIVFDSLARSLIADIETILRAEEKRNASETARAIYFAYLGVLMTASHGAMSLETVPSAVRRAVVAVIGDER